MDLAYVDKLAKDNNGVNYSLVRQNLFDKTVDSKGKKTEDSRETVKTLSKVITKNKRPKNSGCIGKQSSLENSKKILKR